MDAETLMTLFVAVGAPLVVAGVIANIVLYGRNMAVRSELDTIKSRLKEVTDWKHDTNNLVHALKSHIEMLEQKKGRK